MPFFIKHILLRLLLVTILLAPAVTVGAQHVHVLVNSDSQPDAKVMEYTKRQIQEIYKVLPPHGIRYTKNHPLIIAMDWAMPPFSYVNDNGEPDGMFVEIVRQIFSHFRIAHEIRMMPQSELLNQFNAGNIHLIINLENMPRKPHIRCGQFVVATYKESSLRLADTPMLHSIMLLNHRDTLLVNNDSYSRHYLKDFFKGELPFNIKAIDYGKAISAVIHGKAKYFVWDETALRFAVNKYGVADKVKIERVDVPSSGMHFFSRDTLLLHELDLTLKQMQATNQYQRICLRWIGEVKVESKSLSSQVLLLAMLIIAIIIVFILLLRSTMTNTFKREFTTISKLGMEIGHCQLLSINIRKQWVHNVSGDFLPSDGLSYSDFLTLIHPDDRHMVADAKNSIDGGAYYMPAIRLRMQRHGANPVEWRNMVVNAAIKMQHGKPVRVYLVMNDNTDSIMEEHRLIRTQKEYSSITDMSDVGRVYFDRNGRMQHCNNAYVAFFDKGGLGKAAAFLQEKSLAELCVIFNGIILEDDMDTWFCTLIDIPELNLKEAAEIRLRTLYDDNLCCNGFIMALHDKTAVKAVVLDNKAADMDIDQIQKALHKFQSEVSFIMQRNKMYTFQWEVGGNSIELSEGSPYGRRIKFTDYVEHLQESDGQEILAALRDPRKYITQPIHIVRQLKGASKDDNDKWYDTYITPDYDVDGRYKGVFGIRCDITEFMETQNRLREETEKAIDSGKQKALFLQSMTHELRTPLNAINGFAEIMSFLTTDEEKKEYVNIMAHNCTMLISLIDNILQISTIDTEGLKLRKKQVDFAKAFRERAGDLKKYISTPDVDYRISTPMQSLVIKVDAERILQILDIFVNNASKFTHSGFIHVGFRYSHDILTVYCRDTGCGIPQSKQEEIFRRFTKLDEFVQGAGLGLPLAKTIANLMGATIDLYSRENEGTVVSVTLNISSLFTPPY